MGEVARGLIRCSARHCSFRRRRCNEPLPWRFPAAGGWARCCKAGCRLGLAIGPAAPTRVPAHECARRKRRLSPVPALGFAGKVGSTPRYGNCARSTGYCKDCRASGARAGARPACACGARSARRAGGNHRLAGTDHGRHRLCLASPQEIKQAGRTMPAARSRSTVAKNESICFRRSIASRSSVQIRADVGAAVQRTPCSIVGQLCGRRVASAPFLPAPPDPRAAARKSAAARSRRPRAAGQAGRLPCLGRKCAWLALPSGGGRLRRVFAHGSIRCSARRCKAEGRVALAAGPAGARAPGASLRA